MYIPYILADVKLVVIWPFLQQVRLLSLRKDCNQKSHPPSGSPPHAGKWRGDVWAPS